jgi:carboxyl-terminal processing protease
MIRTLIQLGLSLSFILIATVSFSQTTPSQSAMKMGELFNYIDRMYVDEVDIGDLTDKAIRNLLEELDPHSTYIPKDKVDDANERINGSFVGVGIRFQILKDTLLVVQTINGGPSEKVGLLAGDKIIAVEGESIAGIGLKNSDVRAKLLGEKGTKVKITVLRIGNSKPINFTITRDKIPVYSVDSHYMVTPKTGYIKLSSFSRTTEEEILAGISELKKQGMENLVLDLQGNGGGLLMAAQQVADMFLSGDKLIVYSEGKSQPKSVLRAESNGPWEKGRLVVLTDEYSASASEIVSGAIQDWDRGLIVGRRTFGKGLVQRPITLSDGSQIRLTIARYYTPAGRFIQKPYEDPAAYQKDLSQRYLNGEFSSADSISFPDSLKHNTLMTSRTVYSGGGIMPDVFVGLDTTGINDLYKNLARGGYFNSFALTFINDNRKKLEKKYKDFKNFEESFDFEADYMMDFKQFIQKENNEFIWDNVEYTECSNLIISRVKATFAQDLWGRNEFFQVYNVNNEILQKAIKLLEDDSYEKMNLAELK